MEAPILAVLEGAETDSTTKLACDLIAEVAPLVWEMGGWPAVAGMSTTMLFRALTHQEGFSTGALIVGLGSALANTFADMSPRELRDFLVGLEQEAATQFAAKRKNLRVMETEGEA